MKIKGCYLARSGFVLFITLSAACNSDESVALKPAKVALDVRVLDPSIGAAVPKQRCEEVTKAAETLVRGRGRTHLIVLVMGDSEPSALYDGSLKVKKDPFGDPADSEKKAAELVESVRASCEKNIKATKRSPVYRAVLRAKEAIAAKCADLLAVGASCGTSHTITLHSDLRENEVPEIKRALANPSKRNLQAINKYKVELDGIRIRACDVSSSRDPVIGPENLRIVWTYLLGAEMTFSPSCGA
jgi:hypothetical protein